MIAILTTDESKKKEKEKHEKLTLDIVAVEHEIKEENEEKSQEQANAIREKNTERFFIRLQDTSEAREAQRYETEFYETLRTRGVTLEDVQGLNAKFEQTLTPMFNSFAADIRREREKVESQPAAKQETAKVIHFDLTKIPRSDDAEFARIFPVVDKDKNGKLDEAEFSELRQKAHILSVSETLKEGAKHFSNAIAPVDLEAKEATKAISE